MRIAALIALGVLALPSTALARDYPVCLRVYQGYVDYYDECAYTSIPQCQMSASGRAAQCLENPWYAAPVQRQPAPRARTHRRHHRH
ncbi:hypothetical protein HNR60_001096 [Rhodopseudomonas rhenobacensis]|uniref:DUF3551 domain-containing protein n=1 Tax=Rhodopseudomonas rhenobacensis TaxID=87461 RepID=A0A7W7Z1T6_9BRAD|nr:DUF3551 domain-containing protein [Rhodopseudomonas rhenobacensis]MBB5046351.1 hypothetical protein [Rhodopseudomonas rhenobacensis]